MCNTDHIPKLRNNSKMALRRWKKLSRIQSGIFPHMIVQIINSVTPHNSRFRFMFKQIQQKYHLNLSSVIICSILKVCDWNRKYKIRNIEHIMTWFYITYGDQLNSRNVDKSSRQSTTSQVNLWLGQYGKRQNTK